MKRNKILALTVLVLGIIFIMVSLSLVLSPKSSSEDTPQNTTGSTTSNQNNIDDPNVECNHILSSEWVFENGQHFHKCTLDGCDYTDTKILCSGTKATCLQKAVCQFCNSYYGELAKHEWNTEWDYSDKLGHAHKCSFGCDNHSETQPHVPGPAATETTPQTCTECGFIIAPATAHVHSIEKIAMKSATCTQSGTAEHFACKGCSKFFLDSLATQEITDINLIIIAQLEHDFAPATCTKAKTCQREGCNTTEGLALGHIIENKWVSNADFHWHECSVCTQRIDQNTHTPGAQATEKAPQLCIDCGYVITPTLDHVHTLSKISAKQPTCTELGNIEYFVCSGCSKFFFDNTATKEITGNNSISIAPLGHDYSQTTCISPKTCQRSGCGATQGSALGHTPSIGWSSDSNYHWHLCSTCGDHLEQTLHTAGPAATEQAPQICLECNYVIAPKINHVHTLVKIIAQNATCTHDGNIEHFVCSGCTKTFSDASAQNEITDSNLLHIAALGHDFAPATCTAPKICKRDGCASTESSPIGHKPNVDWNCNSNSHWQLCVACGEQLNLKSHTPGPAATEQAPQICIECNYVIAPKLNHIHSLTKVAGQNATCATHGTSEHFICSGCSKIFLDESAINEIADLSLLHIAALGHDFAPATCTDPKICKRNGCGSTEGSPIGHKPNGNWNSDSNYHWQLCTACGDQLNHASHTPGSAATEQAPQCCTKCGYVITPRLEHTHKYDSPPIFDSENHWFECACGHTGNNQAHTDSNQDSKCDICQYQLPTTPNEGDKLEDILGPAQITLLRPVASGVLTKSNSSAVIDYSNFKDGYIMVKYTVDTTIRLKVQVQGPTTTYTYDITPQEWTVFPLSDGNGNYTIKIFKNVVDNRYSTVLSLKFTAELADEFAPFLRPNQYVNFENAANTMNKAAELTAGKGDTLEKVEAIYTYIINNISYDYEKAATIQSGYLPDLEQVLASKKGICFDYASLMAGMLRSQNIACKLVVGYANTEYHAWISVWTPDKGWIDGAIFFDGVKWQMMDPTYASSAGSEIINKVNYTSKYIY